MTKAEAATLLGVSEKTIQNYIKKGRLRVEYVPGKTSPIATFDDGAVEALKAELEALGPKVETGKVEGRNLETWNREDGNEEGGNGEPRKIEQGTQNPRSRNMEPGNALAVPAAAFRGNPTIAISAADLPALAQALVNTFDRSHTSVAVADKTVLTLTEAREITGYSERRLREAIKAGELKALRIGRSDRVHRVALDAWVMAQFNAS